MQDIAVLLTDPFLDQLNKVYEFPQRYILVPGTLLFPYVDFITDYKRYIVLHANKVDIFQCIELNCFRILIIGTVQGIVQAQGILLVIRITEQITEETVLVFS